MFFRFYYSPQAIDAKFKTPKKKIIQEGVWNTILTKRKNKNKKTTRKNTVKDDVPLDQFADEVDPFSFSLKERIETKITRDRDFKDAREIVETQKEIFLNEETHTYFLRENQSIKFISATTLLKQYFSSFEDKLYLIEYNLMLKWNLKDITRKSEQGLAMLAEINQNKPFYLEEFRREKMPAIREEWDKKRQFGIEMHKKIELFYTKNEDPGDLPVDFYVFNRKLKRDGFEPFQFEYRIYDMDSKVAGTVDALFRNKKTGKIKIIDWKFISSMTFNSKNKAKPPCDNVSDTKFGLYSMQLSLYKYILEKNYGFEIEDAIIIQFSTKQNLKLFEYKTFFHRDEAIQILNT